MLSIKAKSQGNLYFLIGKQIFHMMGVKAKDNELRIGLESHPQYPSLLSLKDVFQSFGINSGVINSDAKKLIDFQTPYLCTIKTDDCDIAKVTIVDKIDNGIVTFFNEIQQRWTNVPLDTFAKWFNGIIMLVEKEESFQKNDLFNDQLPRIKGSAFKILGLIFLMTAVGAVAYNALYAYQYIWFVSVFLILNLIGSVLSGGIIWLDVDKHDPTLKKICSIGKSYDCLSILESRGANIFGLSWSVLGFSYFFTNSLSIVLFGFANKSLLIIWMASSALTFPYIFYSLFYQWKIAKQWCLYCLAVLSVLLAQFLNAISRFDQLSMSFQNFEIYPIAAQFLLFVLMLTLTNFFISALKNLREAHQYRSSYLNFKSDQQIFKAVLSNQKQVDFPVEQLGIVIGSVKSEHEIIMVSNPYCGPCSILHSEIIGLINQRPDVRLRIIFTASLQANDFRTPPVRHLIAINYAVDRIRTHQALNDWYSHRFESYDDFATAYPIEIDDSIVDKHVHEMDSFNKKMDIRETPTIYFDGFELPRQYSVSDLIHFK